MTQFFTALELWIVFCLALSAVFATAFPLLYLFSKWNQSKLGRAMMLQSASFALILDLTLLFSFVETTKNQDLVLAAFYFTLIAISTGLLTWMLWRSNHAKWSWTRSIQKETR